jgi:hypothetical protein
MGPVQVYEIFAILVALPLWMCFRRAGLKPWGTLAVFVPFIGFAVAASALAFPRWPALPPKIVKARRR